MTGASLIFVLEMLLKVVDCGIVLHHGAYLHDPWNVLDSFIVLISVVSVTGAGDLPASALKALRMFRTLRPLRLMSRNQGMRMVVNCIIGSLPPCLEMMGICVLFFFIFAVLSLDLFGGQFHK